MQYLLSVQTKNSIMNTMVYGISSDNIIIDRFHKNKHGAFLLKEWLSRSVLPTLPHKYERHIKEATTRSCISFLNSM